MENQGEMFSDLALEKQYDNMVKELDMENKETIEEAAKNYLNSGKIPNDYRSFIEGAKWQQEHYGLMEIELRHTKTLLASCEKALEERDKQQKRSYSEKEMRESFIILDNGLTNFKNK